MTFKVGQPVRILITWKGGGLREWVDGVIVDDSGENEIYLVRFLDRVCARARKNDEGFDEIIPRSTLLWSTREWFSSLRK